MAGMISEVEPQKIALLGTTQVLSSQFSDSQGSGRVPSLRITPPIVGRERTFFCFSTTTTTTLTTNSTTTITTATPTITATITTTAEGKMS